MKTELFDFIYWLKKEHKIEIEKHHVEQYLYIKGRYDKELKNIDNKFISKKNIKGIAQKTRGRLIRNQTTHEKLFKAYLKSLGYKYEFQYVFVVGNYRPYFYVVDFCLIKQKIIFEIDGADHSSKKHFEEDLIRDNWLKEKHGYTVIRFKNNDTTDSKKCMDLIDYHITTVTTHKSNKKP